MQCKVRCGMVGRFRHVCCGRSVGMQIGMYVNGQVCPYASMHMRAFISQFLHVCIYDIYVVWTYLFQYIYIIIYICKYKHIERERFLSINVCIYKCLFGLLDAWVVTYLLPYSNLHLPSRKFPFPWQTGSGKVTASYCASCSHRLQIRACRIVVNNRRQLQPSFAEKLS